MGRTYMVGRNYQKAFESYQEAVYLDRKENAGLWCSIGQLYYKYTSYVHALEAYCGSIFINPYVAETWASLGELYYNCNHQFNDSLSLRGLNNLRPQLDPTNNRYIRINPYISEVWASLGQLYFNCNNLFKGSLEAYSIALELDPTNHVARARVRELKIRLQVHQVPLEDLQGGTIDDEISDDISSYRRSVSIIFYMKTLDY